MMSSVSRRALASTLKWRSRGVPMPLSIQSPRFLSVVMGDGLKRSDMLQCAAEAAAVDWSRQKDVPKGFEKFFKPGGTSDAETSKEATAREKADKKDAKEKQSGSDSKKKSDGMSGYYVSFSLTYQSPVFLEGSLST